MIEIRPFHIQNQITEYRVKNYMAGLLTVMRIDSDYLELRTMNFIFDHYLPALSNPFDF